MTAPACMADGDMLTATIVALACLAVLICALGYAYGYRAASRWWEAYDEARARRRERHAAELREILRR